MPELPEVATVIKYLKTKIINKKITDVIFWYEKVVKNCTPNEFIQAITNAYFEDIQQKGKYLIFHLSNKNIIVIHLRMEGKLFVQPKDSSPNFPQLIAEFVLDNDEVMRFYDTRKFGTFELTNQNRISNLESLNRVTFSALDSQFNAKYLKETVQHSKQSIKTLLLDQSKVAGLGNIYVNEVLFASQILPTRQACNLSFDECKRIVDNSKIILNQAIKLNGTTIHTYKFSEYESGGFQKFLKVQSRKNKPCLNCQKPIAFTKVNGRGTYYCKNCQK